MKGIMIYKGFEVGRGRKEGGSLVFKCSKWFVSISGKPTNHREKI